MNRALVGEKNKISLTAHQYEELNTLLGRIEETQTDSQTGANAIKVAYEKVDEAETWC